ncbi:MAG: hypothetical protein NT163_11085 [Chlorobiales bacterium]|nr:hypothetical protein [Chlorobiales bacterium]
MSTYLPTELDTFPLPTRSEILAAGNVMFILGNCTKKYRDSLSSENFETIQRLMDEYGGDLRMFEQDTAILRDIIFSDKVLLKMLIDSILRSKALLKPFLSAEEMKRHQDNPNLFKFPEEGTQKVAEWINLETAENWLMKMSPLDSEEMARVHLGWSPALHESRKEMNSDSSSETYLHLEELYAQEGRRNLAEEKEVYRIAHEHKSGSTWADCVFDELDEIQKRTRDTSLKVCERFSTIAGIREQAKSLQRAWKLHNASRKKKGLI